MLLSYKHQMMERQQLSEWILLLQPQRPEETPNIPQRVSVRDVSIIGNLSDFEVCCHWRHDHVKNKT